MSTWTLPGYEIEELLGFGATGEVWRARSTATGETVALKRLRPEAGPEAVAALRREAAVLRTLETPFIVRLRDVVGAGAEAVLVLDHAAGGSLASLLARRRVLPPGEVVTVAAPLAQALAVAHARGLVHGDVSPANVLFTGDGMPLLTDLGLARSVGEPWGEALHATAEYLDPAVAAGAEPGPASDVWALGALCFHLLAGTPPYEGELVGEVLDAARARSRAPLGLLAPQAPRALVAVVEGALHDDPSRRPSAGALGVALQRAQTSLPVQLDDDESAQVTPTGRVTHAVPRPGPAHAAPPVRRRRPSAWAVAGSGLTLVLLALGLLWAVRGGGPRPVALPPVQEPVASAGAVAAPVPPGPAAPVVPARPTASAASDWRVVLDDLDRARERAFATGDASWLDGVYEPGSPLEAADRAALGRLVAAGRTATGVRHELHSVAVAARTPERVTLRTEDLLGAQTVRGPDGATVERRPARGLAPFTVVLVEHDDGWRIGSITPL